MKRLLLSMAVVCMSAMVWAQTTTDAAPMTAVDSLAAKIIIIPHIAITSDIPDPAQGLMMDRMKRIAEEWYSGYQRPLTLCTDSKVECDRW